MSLFVNPITKKVASRAVTYAGDALKSVYKPAKRFFKSIFGSSGAVDTLETLPKWLQSGTLEDANRLLKAKLPVRKQVTNQPKPKMVKRLPKELMAVRTGRKIKYYTIPMPKGAKPVRIIFGHNGSSEL